ncbi:MAG: hypothetical protein FJW32_10195 [Acidobacteria bacterium]|nr:hypothetical protein [Acidobacteriota bacterium]
MTPGSSIAHYRIVSKLGEGGMGAVYRATDTKLNRDVALKVLPDAFARDPERLVRFTREAQLLASLNHPNIAAIYGVEDRAIVLELVEGRALQGPLTEAEALPLINQLIDALEYAHEKSVIHRDLKPANILVSTEGKLKVLDFGLAKALAVERVQLDPANSPTLTMGASMEGVIMGTAGYMSPEQARGAKVDKRADIWAFGVVVYELLSGKRLFDGETISDALASVLKYDPDYTVVPKRFHRLLKLCLNRDPQQRLRDISGARYLLEEVAATAERKPARGMTAVVAASTLIAVGAGFIAWKAGQPVDKPPLRLNLDLGSNFADSTFNAFVVSPDGSRVVYPVRAEDGRQILAVRVLTEADASILRGTENATSPFFSPDGASIAFFSESKLKKIDIVSGSVMELAESGSVSRGGDWGDDNRIAFVAGPASGISLVPAFGGPVTALTQSGDGEYVSNRWPQVLPGAKSILYTANRRTISFDDAELVVVDVATNKRTVVHKGGYYGRYTPSGHLLFVRESKIFAVRFDLDRLQTMGTPVPWIQDASVNPIAATGRFSFSLRGISPILAYLPGDMAGVSAKPAWVERGGKSRLHSGRAMAGSRSRLSPDGKRVVRLRGGLGAADVEIWDMNRDTVINITSDGKAYEDPIWLPDGKYVVFSGQNANLWIALADGSREPKRLLEPPNRPFPGSFTPDGRNLVYRSIAQSASAIRDLWIVPLDLSNPNDPKAGTPARVKHATEPASYAEISPDGKWVAYASSEITVRPLEKDAGRWRVPSGVAHNLRWAKKSKELLYATPDGRLMSVPYRVEGDSFIAD